MLYREECDVVGLCLPSVDFQSQQIVSARKDLVTYLWLGHESPVYGVAMSAGCLIEGIYIGTTHHSLGY